MDYLFVQNSIKLFFVVFLVLIMLRLIAMTTLGFLIIKKHATEKIKIQNKPLNKKLLVKEIIYSILTMTIFALGFSCIYAMFHANYNQIYTNPKQYGIIWLLLSLVLYVFLHDAYFYWAHRFMHIKGIFVHVHKVHHYSYNPNLWSSFSFHPFEAILETLFLVVVTCIVPINPWMLLVFVTIMYLHVFYIHSGYEFLPAGFTQNRLTKYLITATHHNIHHSKNRSNYGLYFTFWDRLCNTTHNQYDEIFDHITRKEE